MSCFIKLLRKILGTTEVILWERLLQHSKLIWYHQIFVFTILVTPTFCASSRSCWSFKISCCKKEDHFLASDLAVNIGQMTMINVDHQHHQHHSSTQTLAVFEICLIKSDTLHFLISQQPGEDNLYYFSETVNFNVPAHRSKIFIRKTLNKYLIEIFFHSRTQPSRKKTFWVPLMGVEPVTLWARLFKAGLRKPTVSAKFEFRYRHWKSKFSLIPLVCNMVIGCSKKNSQGKSKKMLLNKQKRNLD